MKPHVRLLMVILNILDKLGLIDVLKGRVCVRTKIFTRLNPDDHGRKDIGRS